jgi:hypothetical protein
VDNLELVTLNTFTSIFEANMFRSKLESEGIECFIDDENIGSMNFLYGSAVGGVKLKVRKSDYDKARKVLEESGQTIVEVEEEQNDDNPACPSCGSRNTEYAQVQRKFNVLSILLLGFPILFPGHGYKCNDCNHEWEDNSGTFLKVIRVLFCIAIVAAVLYMLGHRKKM